MIRKIVFAVVAMIAATGVVKADDNLTLENKLTTNATVKFYVSDTEPTASYTPGAEATSVLHGKYLIVKVEPADGYWTYNGAVTFQVAAGIGGAEAPRRAIKLPVNPTAVSSNKADGTGYYYYKIPDDCTEANGYKKVIFDGEVFQKIDLSSAAIDGTGKIVTKTTDGWTATITLNEVNFTYNGMAQVPAISSFTLSNGSKTFDNTAQQVSISGSMTNAGNYNATLAAVADGCLLNSKQVPFSIGKKAVTLTSGSKTREYNGTALTNAEVEGTNANGLTVETGWVEGEGVTYSFTGSQTLVGESTNAFSYEAKSGTLLSNYTITKTEGKLTVTQNNSAITVTPGSGSKVYDGTPLTKTAHEDFTVTGVPGGFTWTATADGTVTNVTPGAGEKAVNGVTSFKIFKGENDVTNQFSDITTTAVGTLTVTQREITASVADKDVTYNGTEQSGNSDVVFTNVVGGQTASVSYTAAKGTMASTYDNGSYGTDLKVMSGMTDVTSNYKLTSNTTGKLIIANASTAITITAASQSWTYDGGAHTNTTVTVTSGTLFDGDALVATATGSVTNVSDSGIGNNPVAAGYKVMHGDNDVTANYAITVVAGTLTIKPKDLTVIAKDNSITYGDAPTNDGVTYSGFAGTENESALSGTLAYEYSYTQYGDVGDSYTITPSGLTNGNYNIIFKSGTLTVNQKEVGLNWTNLHPVYNGTPQAPTAEATGLVNGDEIGVTVTVEGEHTTVGNYTATASALTGAKVGNYKLPVANTHEFSIVEAGMSGIEATGYNNTYDGTAHGIQVTIPDGATVKYGESLGTYDLDDSPTYKDVCEKTVYYKVTKEGFTDVTGSAKVIITQLTGIVVTITGHNNKVAFDGMEHSVSGYDVKISNDLYKEADFTFNGTSKAARTDVGKTYMELAADQFTNDNANFASVTFNVTDGYQEITSIDEVIVTITGHINTTDFDGKEHSMSGYDVSFSNALYTESDFSFSGTAEAKRTDAGKTMMGLDESQFKNTNKNFSNVTFVVTDGYQAISSIAATVTITGHHDAVTFDGAEQSVSG